MRYLPLLALLALLALPVAAVASGSGVPLQALTEADVGADALASSACYVHDGPSVLLVATKRNAIVNSEGDLLLLDRLDDDGYPHGGARYGSNSFRVVISPAGAADGAASGGRSDRAAQVSVRRKGESSSIQARWACNPRKGA